MDRLTFRTLTEVIFACVRAQCIFNLYFQNPVQLCFSYPGNLFQMPWWQFTV